MEINYEETKKLLEERSIRIKNINALTIASMGVFTIVGGLSTYVMIKNSDININNICLTAIPSTIVLAQGINLYKNLVELKKIKRSFKDLEDYKSQKTLKR